MITNYLTDMTRIIEAALSGDATRVCSYTGNLAKKLESAGEARAAHRLRSILKGDSTELASLAYAVTPESIPNAAPIPLDSDSGMAIAEEQRYAPRSVMVSLSGDAADYVTKFLSYFAAHAKLKRHGVDFTPSLLMYGPPGCGKTQVAKYIASETGLPIIVARMDGLISSYLGSTSKNLRRLFDYAAAHPCILFLDEFDALAKMRDDDREMGELKRVVISLLQNIDSLGSDHVLLAATNHEHLLDPAIWRRFTYKVNIKPPDLVARQELFKQFLGNFSDDDAIEIFSSISDGLSGSQIRDLVVESVRNAVVHDLDQVDSAALMRELIAMTASGDSEVEHMNTKAAVCWLHDKSFTQSRISSIVGISQPRVSQILKEIRHGKKRA